MNSKQTIWSVIAILILGGVTVAAYQVYKSKQADTQNPANITSFEECAKVYATVETYPPQCKTPDGKTFSQDIGNELSKLTLITIDAPRPNSSITSPLEITGKARGTWFFEASFPVELQNAAGTVIAQAPAQAQGDWMTENFVPYNLTLTYPPQPTGSKGKLILKKDNPSGDASRDDSLIVPITF